MRRKLVALSLLVLGALAVARRLRAGAPERVELVYEDGEHVTLTDVDAAPLLAIARDALRPL